MLRIRLQRMLELLERAIQLSKGSIADAANGLGISVATIYRKLKAYGIHTD